MSESAHEATKESLEALFPLNDGPTIDQLHDIDQYAIMLHLTADQIDKVHNQATTQTKAQIILDTLRARVIAQTLVPAPIEEKPQPRGTAQQLLAAAMTGGKKFSESHIAAAPAMPPLPKPNIPANNLIGVPFVITKAEIQDNPYDKDGRRPKQVVLSVILYDRPDLGVKVVYLSSPQAVYDFMQCPPSDFPMLEVTLEFKTEFGKDPKYAPITVAPARPVPSTYVENSAPQSPAPSPATPWPF
jgi:hypothetical protein